jgi:hypothetical protein
LKGDTPSPFLFTLFFELFLPWLTVGSQGYRPSAPTINIDPIEPTATYPDQGFTDDLGLAMGSPTNPTTKLQKLSLFCAYKAPAGGAAAAAPERGALAGPLAPTSTSTRWALVAP